MARDKTYFFLMLFPVSLSCCFRRHLPLFFGPLWSTSPRVLKADSLEELLFPQPACCKQGAVLPEVRPNIAQIVPAAPLKLWSIHTFTFLPITVPAGRYSVPRAAGQNFP